MMKKSLFLLLLLSCCASSFATHVSSSEWAVASDSLPPVVGALSVGTSLGEGRVDVAPGTMWTLPGALFIGGSGNYSGAPNTGGHDGIFTMGTGSSLLAGGSDMTANGAQSHINVGNSRFPITGTLEIAGGRLQAEQLVVGYNAGTGIVRVSDGGHLVLTNDKAELGPGGGKRLLTRQDETESPVRQMRLGQLTRAVASADPTPDPQLTQRPTLS